MQNGKINVRSEITLREFTKELLNTPSSLSIGYLVGKIEDTEEGTVVVVEGVNMPKEWAGRMHVLDDSDLERAIKAERENGRNIVGIAAYIGPDHALGVSYPIEPEYSQVRASRGHLASKGIANLSVQFGVGIHDGKDDYKTFPKAHKIFS